MEKEKGKIPAEPDSRKKLRLLFDDEKNADPALEKPMRKAKRAAHRLDKTEIKLDKAETRLPTKKALRIRRAADAETGKKAVRLHFEDVQKPKPLAPMKTPMQSKPVQMVQKAQYIKGFADKISTDDPGNVSDVGIEAAEKAVGKAKSGLRFGSEVVHAQKLRPHRKLEKAQHRYEKADRLMDRANVKVLQKEEALQNPQSNVFSKWQQRRAIKHGYLTDAGKTTGATIKKRVTENVKESLGQMFRRSKRGLTVAGLLFMVYAMLMNGLSSCSPLAQSGFQAIAVSTYPAEEAEMKSAERIYAGMEKELKEKLDHYERDHDYHEYHFDVDEIWHDPHALMAIISAWYGGEIWTADQAYGTMEMLFRWQYKLTEDIQRETRYRQEERTGYYTYTDPETGETEQRPYTYYVDVPYDYYTANITLINQNLSYAPIYIMNEERIGMYAMYKSTLGNHPDLFRGNPYVRGLKDPVRYDIPPEHLENPAFAALMAEATKYVGYPYVWGGSKPTTSFDCSGFVSWVYTESGVLNTGRLGATSLYGVCRAITPEEAKPGDLVFFQGTLPRADGITHVGIYVGDGMMIHCGDPITFADLSERYWVDHFFGFGHPPIDLEERIPADEP